MISTEVVVEKYNPWKQALLAGIFFLLVGILIIVLKSEGLKWALIIAGVFMLISGILTIVEGMKSHFTVGIAMGVITVVLGLAMIILPNLFSDILMILLAVGLIIVGAVSVLDAGSDFAVAAGSRVISILVGAIMVVLGIIALLNLKDTADIVMIVIGALLAVAGIMRIYGAYQLKKVC